MLTQGACADRGEGCGWWKADLRRGGGSSSGDGGSTAKLGGLAIVCPNLIVVGESMGIYSCRMSKRCKLLVSRSESETWP